MRNQKNNKGELGVVLHQFLNNTRFFGGIRFTKQGSGKKIFFPGCSFNGYDPSLVIKVYDFLCNHYEDLGISTDCCGKPGLIIKSDKYPVHKARLLKSFEDNRIDEIITCCPNCTKLLSEITAIKITPIYSVLEEYFVGEPNHNLTDVGLHDPCPFRKDESVHNSIRNILSRIKINITEFPNNRNNTRCCGKSNMLFARNKEKALLMAKNRAFEVDNDTIVTYCFSCVDSFKRVSKKSVHLLEIMFGQEKDTSHAVWINRIKLRGLLNEYRINNE